MTALMIREASETVRVSRFCEEPSLRVLPASITCSDGGMALGRAIRGYFLGSPAIFPDFCVCCVVVKSGRKTPGF